MFISTTRFGRLPVDPADLITMSRGLVGFPASTRYILLEPAAKQPFYWLQSWDDPSLAFIMIDPHLFFPDYEVHLSDDQTRRLGVESPEEVQVLTTLSIRADSGEMTTNLLGPLLIGVNTLRAEQLILDGSRYSTRHPLPRVESTGGERMRSAAPERRALQSVA